MEVVYWSAFHGINWNDWDSEELAPESADSGETTTWKLARVVVQVKSSQRISKSEASQSPLLPGRRSRRRHAAHRDTDDVTGGVGSQPLFQAN